MLAMTCDFIIAADDSQIGWPGQRLGFAGSGEWSFGPLVYSIGLRRALDLWITGRIIRDGIAIGKATRHLFYDMFRITGMSHTIGYITHTMFTKYAL